MSRHPFPVFLILLLCVGGCLPEERSADLQLTLDLDHPQPLSHDLYGANTEALHLPVWFDQPAFAEKYKAVGSPFIRFPGGTPSNFYNPMTGLFDDDSPSDRQYGDQNKKLLKVTNDAGLKPDAFFAFAKAHDLRCSLVLNVCTQSFEQNQAWLESLAAAGSQIPAIEIGNEVFYGSYTWAFPKPRDYLERSRKLTVLIRKLFPGTMVGLVFPTQLYQDETFVQQGDRDKPSAQYEWMTMLEGETFYDALVVHLYSLTRMSNSTKPEEFLPHLEGYTESLAMLERRLEPTLAELESRFPDKELWITEFGIGGFGGNLKQYTLRYSHLGALHTDLMLLRFTQHPPVTIADWHSFNHFFDGNRDGTGFEDHENLTFTHFSLFREPIRQSNQVVPVKVTGSDNVEAFGFKGPEKIHVMLVNKGERSFTLSKPDLPARLTAGVQLLHRTDQPLAQAMQNTERCERVLLTPEQLQFLTLPPYSITRLEMELP